MNGRFRPASAPTKLRADHANEAAADVVQPPPQLGHTQFERVCALSAITNLVTDAPLPDELAGALSRGGTRTHVAAT